jgi:hypothetical protein
VAHGTLNPLMLRPYSQNQPDFRSENELTLRWMWTLREATGGRGIWLIDRAADRPEVLSGLLRVQKRWVVRLRQDRALVGPDGRVLPAGQWAEWALANRPARGNAVTLAVSLPPEDVPQYGTPPNLHLVVPTYAFVRNGKAERWLLLTCGLIGHHVGPRQVRYDYALRWRAEDGKRFLRSLGQICRVERFLTRSFAALERMLWCATLAGGFLSHLRREEPELSRQLQEEVLYEGADPVLPVYRLARGLPAACTRPARGGGAARAGHPGGQRLTGTDRPTDRSPHPGAGRGATGDHTAERVTNKHVDNARPGRRRTLDKRPRRLLIAARPCCA